MKVYKVCRLLNDGRMTSALYNGGQMGLLNLEYKIDETTTPKIPGSKIFVFANLEDAHYHTWLTGVWPHVILEGEATDTESIEYTPQCGRTAESYVKFWAGKDVSKYLAKIHAPMNFVAGSFTPTGVVEWYTIK